VNYPLCFNPQEHPLKDCPSHWDLVICPKACLKFPVKIFAPIVALIKLCPGLTLPWSLVRAKLSYHTRWNPTWWRPFKIKCKCWSRRTNNNAKHYDEELATLRGKHQANLQMLNQKLTGLDNGSPRPYSTNIDLALNGQWGIPLTKKCSRGRSLTPWRSSQGEGQCHSQARPSLEAQRDSSKNHN